MVGPKVDVKKIYNPGFTIPYCPPEVFTHRAFNVSQDIFSFGMIVFRVICNALPFFASDKLKNIYTNRTYHEYIYLAP